jgi:chloride channel 2
LSKFKIFSDIEKNKALKKQMFGVAVAAGIIATFGTTFGGIIFSIELTATYFMVSSLWKCFFCSTITILSYWMFHQIYSVPQFAYTDYMQVELDYELIFFALLGILSGILASLFNLILSKMVFLRVKLRQPFISNRWKWCFTISLFISTMSYPIHFMWFNEK